MRTKKENLWGNIIDYFLSVGNNPERTVTILGKVAEMVSKLDFINYVLTILINYTTFSS